MDLWTKEPLQSDELKNVAGIYTEYNYESDENPEAARLRFDVKSGSNVVKMETPNHGTINLFFASKTDDYVDFLHVDRDRNVSHMFFDGRTAELYTCLDKYEKPWKKDVKSSEIWINALA